MPDVVTDRFVLDRPTMDDVDGMFALESDPRVWTDLPSGRVALRQGSAKSQRRRIGEWERDGLGAWMVRETIDGPVVGICGCSIRGGLAAETGGGAFWNLGYRFRPEVQGRGLATTISRLAVVRAHAVHPDRPVVAYLLEHNRGSARVAEKLGLTLRHRGPDAGNPDPAAVRVVYADRELTAAQAAAALA